MFIKMDFQSEIPIYQQLKNQIIIGIASGKIEYGESLPSVRQLASDIGVNLHTINKAYNQLKVEGYVEIDRRKGATISSKPKSPDVNKKENLIYEFTNLISTAICGGYTQEDILEITKDVYKMIKEGNFDE